jgi:hypothetical protein
MSERTIASQVAEILARTGIGRQIADENEANRAAQHADLRKRKAAALALFQKQKPVADAATAAADVKAAEAKKLADQALNDYIAARAKLDTVYGTLTGTLEPIDKEMLTCYDPAIDAFVAELNALKIGCGNLYRLSEDKQSNNSVAVNARVRALMDACDAANRLKIDPSIEDMPAAIASIRTSIPKA